MTGYQVGAATRLSTDHDEKLNASGGNNTFAVNVADTMALQSNKLAEHEGKLAGLTAIVQSLQSYKGFLQAAILAVGSLLFVGIGLVYSVGSANSVRLERGQEGLSSRLSVLEVKVDALPDRVSRELREVSRDLILIRGGDADSEALARRGPGKQGERPTREKVEGTDRSATPLPRDRRD